MKLWHLPCVVSLSVILYTMNIFHTYRLSNAGMTTTRKTLRKIGISHNFFSIVAYIVIFICLKPRKYTKKCCLFVLRNMEENVDSYRQQLLMSDSLDHILKIMII